MLKLDASHRRTSTPRPTTASSFTRVFALLLGGALLALAAGCESEASSGEFDDVSTASDVHANDVNGSDVSAEDWRAAETACAQRDGICVPGAPDMEVPGFTVTCPAGTVLDNGETSETNGGNDMIYSELALGCSENPDGTTTPALCCLPE